MTEFKEEQNEELQALEAIYSDELKVISLEPEIKFKLSLKVESEDKDEIYSVDMIVSLPAKYPSVPPLIDLNNFGGHFEEEDKKELLNLLDENVKSNLGMVMIFNLVSFTTEWLNNRCDAIRLKKFKDLEVEKKKKEEEEMKKFEGTKVTIETFLAWKKNFELEMSQFDQNKNDSNIQKLTGRELFEKYTSLNESDLLFLEDDETDQDFCYSVDSVKVDESLFQDLDDLSLNE